MSDEPLDNIVWWSLTTHQSGLAERAGGAVRYPSDVNVFYAVERLDDAAWRDLALLAGPGRSAVLFRDRVPPPAEGWTVQAAGVGVQMVLDALGDDVPAADIRPLDEADAAAMLELARAAQPGPFVARTHALGRFRGVFEGGRLVAMAGERMHVPGFHEISAVCTDAAARGRGLAAALAAEVARGILADGERPVLHVASTNHGARRVYERLGFAVRREVDFTVLRTPS